MKIAITFITLTFVGIVFSQDSWQQMDSVKGPAKGSCAAFVLQNEGFIIGGLDDFGFKRKMYSYDPSQNDWDDELSIGGLNGDGLDRGSASSFSINGKGYICLGQGQTNPYFRDLWEYNHETQAWTQKADFIGTARRQAVGFALDEFGYVGTGQDALGLCKDFYRFDPLTNSWTQLNDFPGTARRQAVAFTMGAEAFLGTGDDGVLRNDFWMYETSTDTWIQKANFPGTPRAGATGWGIFPTGFIATGEDINFDYTKDVWEYNYFSNSWVQRADLPASGRKNAIAFVLNGIAYLGTGFNGTFLDDFYAYTGIVGVNELAQHNLSSFPNPMTEQTSFIWNQSIAVDQIKIYSITGSNVTEQFEIIATAKGFDVNRINALSGHYIVSFPNSNKQLIRHKMHVL